MHIVGDYFNFDHFAAKILNSLHDYCLESTIDTSTEHTSAIFGAPNQVVLRWVHGPVCRPVVHNKNLRIRCVSVGSLSRAGLYLPQLKQWAYRPTPHFGESSRRSDLGLKIGHYPSFDGGATMHAVVYCCLGVLAREQAAPATI